MVSIYLGQALKFKKYMSEGSKDRFRDMVYIDDVINAFNLSIKNKIKGYNCFNVCTGVRTKVEQIIKSILNHLNFEVSVKYEGSTPGDYSEFLVLIIK